MAEKVRQHAVVKEFSIGNTRVKICNDFCRHDPEEINAILERIAQRALEAFSATASENAVEQL